MRIEGRGGAIEAVPIPLEHGDMPSLGFRFGSVAYSPDVGGIPEALLNVPFVATLAPIAWVLGAELRVPVVDATFFESLRRVRESLRALHPGLAWDGEVHPETVVDCRGTYSSEGEAILFSGGVDSLASFVMHRDAKPRLVAVWGADVGLGARPQWERVAGGMRAFAGRSVAPAPLSLPGAACGSQISSRFFGSSKPWPATQPK